MDMPGKARDENQLNSSIDMELQDILYQVDSSNSETAHQNCGRLPRSVVGLQTLTRALLSLVENISTDIGVKFHGRRKARNRLAEQIYNERQRRDRFFPADLFGEPAWDILLDLFVASRSNQPRSIKEVCISSRVPDATALRYIGQLAAYGLVERRPDKTDQRRKFLRLSPTGYRHMLDYLDSMQPLGDDAAEMVRDLTQPD
jgi:DNA-binding MarR family transcriptional regulator